MFLTQKHLCIAMEYAPGGDLFEYVVRKKGLKEEEARWFFQQLIIAIDYCHRMVFATKTHILIFQNQCIEISIGCGKSRCKIGEYFAGCESKTFGQDL